MSQVTMYLLSIPTDDMLLTVCKLAAQHTAVGRKVYGYSDQYDEATDLDQRLWTFKDGSFVSHELYRGAAVEEPLPAMLVGLKVEPPATHQDVLINLSITVPEWCGRFERVIEVVPKGTELRSACRNRFKRYRELGHDIKTYQLEPDGKWKLLS